MTANRSRRLRSFAWVALLGGCAAAIAFLFRDYGASWDESTNLRYGELVLRYFTSGLRDRSVDGFLNLRWYGPLFDLLSAAVARLAPAANVEIHHLLTALAALSILPALGRMGRLLESPSAGLWAAVALATMPVFVGHAFVNGKDIPFACAFTWSAVLLIDLILRGPTWRRTVICGLTFGAAAAIRPAGLPLLVGLLLAAGALASVTGRLELRGRVRALAVRAGALVAVAWVVMIAFWPWAHADPITRPVQAMRVAASFPAVYPVLFEGGYVASDALPRRYLLEHFAITTPPTLMLLAAAGLIVVARWCRTEPRRDRSLAAAVTVLWLFAPVLLWTLGRPNILDGMRHFLFVLPALAALAGVGVAASWDGLRTWSARRRAPEAQVASASGVPTEAGDPGAIPKEVSRPGSPSDRLVLAGGGLTLAVLLLAPWPDLVRLHPYQMTYFNGFAGGLSGASGRYETDYWLTSYKEAMDWIQKSRPSSDARPSRVLVAANELSRLCAEHYAGANTTITTIFTRETPHDLPPEFDVYLATTRYGLDANYPGTPIVHTIGRDGALFAVVRARTASLTQR